jgi:membrane protein DedA with SNARE-associated domain
MVSAPDLLAHYGTAVVFAWAFAVQAGLPAPAVPMLLGAGALSGSGHMDPAVAILAAMTATLAAANRARYLIVAKFLPGVNPLAAGLAGVVALRVDFFLFYAAAGALLWAGAWIMVAICSQTSSL